MSGSAWGAGERVPDGDELLSEGTFASYLQDQQSTQQSTGCFSTEPSQQSPLMCSADVLRHNLEHSDDLYESSDLRQGLAELCEDGSATVSDELSRSGGSLFSTSRISNAPSAAETTVNLSCQSASADCSHLTPAKSPSPVRLHALSDDADFLLAVQESLDDKDSDLSGAVAGTSQVTAAPSSGMTDEFDVPRLSAAGASSVSMPGGKSSGSGARMVKPAPMSPEAAVERSSSGMVSIASVQAVEALEEEDDCTCDCHTAGGCDSREHLCEDGSFCHDERLGPTPPASIPDLGSSSGMVVDWPGVSESTVAHIGDLTIGGVAGGRPVLAIQLPISTPTHAGGMSLAFAGPRPASAVSSSSSASSASASPAPWMSPAVASAPAFARPAELRPPPPNMVDDMPDPYSANALSVWLMSQFICLSPADSQGSSSSSWPDQIRTGHVPPDQGLFVRHVMVAGSSEGAASADASTLASSIAERLSIFSKVPRGMLEAYPPQIVKSNKHQFVFVSPLRISSVYVRAISCVPGPYRTVSGQVFSRMSLNQYPGSVETHLYALDLKCRKVADWFMFDMVVVCEGNICIRVRSQGMQLADGSRYVKSGRTCSATPAPASTCTGGGGGDDRSCLCRGSLSGCASSLSLVSPAKRGSTFALDEVVSHPAKFSRGYSVAAAGAGFERGNRAESPVPWETPEVRSAPITPFPGMENLSLGTPSSFQQPSHGPASVSRLPERPSAGSPSGVTPIPRMLQHLRSTLMSTPGAGGPLSSRLPLQLTHLSDARNRAYRKTSLAPLFSSSSAADLHSLTYGSSSSPTVQLHQPATRCDTPTIMSLSQLALSGSPAVTRTRSAGGAANEPMAAPAAGRLVQPLSLAFSAPTGTVADIGTRLESSSVPAPPQGFGSPPNPEVAAAMAATDQHMEPEDLVTAPAAASPLEEVPGISLTDAGMFQLAAQMAQVGTQNALNLVKTLIDSLQHQQQQLQQQQQQQQQQQSPQDPF